MTAKHAFPRLAILSFALIAAPIFAATSGGGSGGGGTASSGGGGSSGAGHGGGGGSGSGGGHAGSGAGAHGGSLGAHGAANSSHVAQTAVAPHMAAAHATLSHALANTDKKPGMPHPIFNPRPYRYTGGENLTTQIPESCIPSHDYASAYWSNCDRPSKAGTHR
jgi:hypothetical protein